MQTITKFLVRQEKTLRKIHFRGLKERKIEHSEGKATEMTLDDVRPGDSSNEKDHVSTSTSRGVINFWNGTRDNDEWFSYAEITERILRFREEYRAKQQDGAGDEKRDMPMRKSLFPHVAPYVLFHSFDCKCPELPSSIGKYLRWRANRVIPKIVAQIVKKSGYRLETESIDWSGTWGSSSSDLGCFKNIRIYQKINCFPGSLNIGRKDRLWRHYSRMRQKFGSLEFNFVPSTYVLPGDMKKFQNAWQKTVGDRWIVKPTSSGRGQGIRIVDKWWEIPKWRSVVVQRYLSSPKLINGTKFDLRVYVLVTSIDPLYVYVYKEGLVRFASVKYVANAANLDDLCMHLTNTSINKWNPNYVRNNRIDSTRGNKWSFYTLWQHLSREGVDVNTIWSGIKDIVVKTLVSGENDMYEAFEKNITSRYTCYELYGFDVLLDENCKPWLLEVNTSPSLHTDTLLDVAIKGPLIRNVLNIAGYQIPGDLTIFQERQLVRQHRSAQMCQDYRIYSTNLTSREKLKHAEFRKINERAEYVAKILRDITRDDVRQLIVYEDQLTQLNNFDVTFPSSDSYKYLKFYETPRYYNRLLDAWVSQSSSARKTGINRLRSLCSKRIHLESMIC